MLNGEYDRVHCVVRIILTFALQILYNMEITLECVYLESIPSSPSLCLLLTFHYTSQPTLRPKANPATNDALCWKSAVKKSTIHRKSDATDGGFLATSPVRASTAVV